MHVSLLTLILVAALGKTKAVARSQMFSQRARLSSTRRRSGRCITSGRPAVS